MRCKPERIHELELQIQHGDKESAVKLCDCFIPEINFATRPSKQMQSDAIQEVRNILIRQVIAQNYPQIKN